MAKKVVKKTAKKAKKMPPGVEIQNQEVEAPKVEKKPAKDFKAPIGTNLNPRPITPRMADALIDDQTKEGVFSVIMIESKEPKGKWEVHNVAGTPKQAQKTLTRLENHYREQWVIAQREAWSRENMNNRQEISQQYLRVTERTSDEQIEKFVEAAKEERRRLKENPPAKMPKFKKSDAVIPQFRLMEVRVTVEKRLVLDA